MVLKLSISLINLTKGLRSNRYQARILTTRRTRRGHFTVNCSPRVVMNPPGRSPFCNSMSAHGALEWDKNGLYTAKFYVASGCMCNKLICLCYAGAGGGAGAAGGGTEALLPREARPGAAQRPGHRGTGPRMRRRHGPLLAAPLHLEGRREVRTLATSTCMLPIQGKS